MTVIYGATFWALLFVYLYHRRLLREETAARFQFARKP